jgi:thiol-disulfide isomerase/thioredoxin
MVAATSIMVPLGSEAPDFNLLDTRNNQWVSLKDYKSDIATVIMFLCNHCPYVKHIQKKIVAIAEKYQKEGIQFVAISSNDAEQYPDDGPEQMRHEAETVHYAFPYLYDETQEVAKAYQAACTPDFFIFDKNLRCVYRGCLDDSTPGNGIPVTGIYIQNALDKMLAFQPVDRNQKPSIGCSIKWK